MALVGMGLGLRSPDSKSQDSTSLWFISVARATSPEKNASIMATVSGVTQWDATLTTPTAPTASRAKVKASSPL